ncbi:MAG: FMN-binding protein [Myxococcota bacterium]
MIFVLCGCKKEKRLPDDTNMTSKKQKNNKNLKSNNSKQHELKAAKNKTETDKKGAKTTKKKSTPEIKDKNKDNQKKKSNLLHFPGEKITKPVLHKKTKDNKKVFYQLDSFDFERAKVKGYAAPIRLQVVFDKKGKIIQVEIKDHKETKSFIKRIEKEWLSELSGLEPNRKILGKDGIDALTECTKSTEAIKKSVDTLRNLFLEKFNKKQSSSQK